ncbi:hypothetical protein [Streptacidiphilus sp. EB129]|uniref:hypothetical protein n=1 Tax=Streptacidiphilus sp. EB129 TaxID=3156262 RepID=UPI0035183131
MSADPVPWSARLLERVRRLGLLGLDGAVPAGQDGDDAASGPTVSGLRVAAGSVSARVDDCDVWLDLRVFEAPQWARIEQAVAADRELVERLLDGEVPDSVDAVLARAGLSLLPARAADLTLECSCPQWAVCRHIAAVFAAFGAAVDADPFLLFGWRGRDRERLLRHLRELRAAVVVETPADPAPERPLAECLDDFWTEGDRHRRLRLAESPDRAGRAEAAAARLGPSGIVIRGRTLEALLQPAYDALID